MSAVSKLILERHLIAKACFVVVIYSLALGVEARRDLDHHVVTKLINDHEVQVEDDEGDALEEEEPDSLDPFTYAAQDHSKSAKLLDEALQNQMANAPLELIPQSSLLRQGEEREDVRTDSGKDRFAAFDMKGTKKQASLGADTKIQNAAELLSLKQKLNSMRKSWLEYKMSIDQAFAAVLSKVWSMDPQKSHEHVEQTQTLIEADLQDMKRRKACPYYTDHGYRGCALGCACLTFFQCFPKKALNSHSNSHSTNSTQGEEINIGVCWPSVTLLVFMSLSVFFLCLLCVIYVRKLAIEWQEEAAAKEEANAYHSISKTVSLNVSQVKGRRASQQKDIFQ